MTPLATLYLVITGAPLARRVGTAVNAAMGRGWAPVVIATEAALGWLDPTPLRDRGVPVLTDHRSPMEPKRQPPADAVLVAPATFNTVNKLAGGIADSYPLGVLAEMVGTGTPMIIVPFVNEKLAGHPIWPESVRRLRRPGVSIMDPRDGRLDELTPIVPGTGEQVADEFDWTRPIDVLSLEILDQSPR